MNTRQSFWDVNPEIRDFAARLDADGVNSAEIRERIREQFGGELVPSAPRITALRKGLVSGRWQVPTVEKKSEPVVEAAPEAKDEPKRPARKPHFWDRYPEMRDVALGMLPFENNFIVSELTKRFKTLPKDTRKRLADLRYGVLQGRWSVPERLILPRKTTKTVPLEAEKPVQAPTKALTLLNVEWVGCKIRGVVCLSGRACLTRQLSAAKRDTGRQWKPDGNALAIHPGFGPCVGCVHWVPDDELQAAHEIMYGLSPPRGCDNGQRIL